MDFSIDTLNWERVEYWFYIFNDLSLVYVFIPFFIIELIRYKFQKKLNWDMLGDSLANVITLLAFLAIEAILGFLFVIQLYFWVHANTILPHLPLNLITIISCVLLADFAYYWEHRMMHRLSIGWATHTVHHSSPHFNISVAYRFGPLDAVFPLPFSLLIVFLGFNPLLVFASEIFVQTYQTALHTELIKKAPAPLEYIFNTPSHHRVHHGSNRQYFDKNYGGILILWDRLLGTFTPEKEKVIYGVSQPIESNNPLVVFFHGFPRFYQDMKNIKGFFNKILFLAKPPGWRPKIKVN